MDIKLDKQESNEALIKITLKEDDYQPQVSQKIREYSKKAHIKGFRPGKVPMGLIKKMYGKSILVDEINRLLSASVNNYIRDHDLKILGDPLPNLEKSRTIDWDHQKDFEFEYNIGLVEDFKYDLSKKRKVTEYTLKIEPKTIDEELLNLRKNYGERIHPEQSAAGDMIHGELSEPNLDIKNPITLFIDQVEKKEQKQFIGKKAGDVITFKFTKAITNPAHQARLLGIDQEKLDSLKPGNASLTVEAVSRIEPAALDQEFFDKLLGKDQVKSEEELREKIREYLANSYARETENFLFQSIKNELLGAVKINFPDDFVKRWLVSSNEGDLTTEDVEKEYDQYAREMKWNLILNRIAEDHEIKVENEEVVTKAKDLLRAQLASSGIATNMEDQMDAFADNYLKGNEGQNYLQVFNQVRRDKIMDFIREKITIQKKEVDLEQFRKAVAKS